MKFLFAMLLALSATPALASGMGGMFAQGRSQFSLMAGNAYAFDYSYFVIGGSASYNVMNGLGVGLSLEHWSGPGPAITKYAPFVQYVLYQASAVQPYVGGFYRHTTITDLPSINSAGARAGVLMASGSNAYFSFGFLYESYLNCQVSVYRVCSEAYPEIGLIFSF